MIKHIFFLFIFISSFGNAQSLYFEGSWTKTGTTYEFPFQLVLIHQENIVEGYFLWQIQELDENNSISKMYYESKLGLNAKEFVKGSYDLQNETYYLKGYKKEDPHNIISLDSYKLKISKEGIINGSTKSDGNWHGRIDGKEIRLAI